MGAAPGRRFGSWAVGRGALRNRRPGTPPNARAGSDRFSQRIAKLARELRRTLVTLRDYELRPPDWRQLALDLGDWGTRLPRKHEPGGPYEPRTVADRWVQDFHGAGWDFPA
ncbi:hypothetical protein DBP19_35855 [Streptomyces sp. CS090A]|nr:hypothetical protein DBP19_35855 [Streptomyces sp. CS090A]